MKSLTFSGSTSNFPPKRSAIRSAAAWIACTSALRSICFPDIATSRSQSNLNDAIAENDPGIGYVEPHRTGKRQMPTTLDLVPHPELVFGIAGPIGVDMDEITESLTNALKGVQYAAQPIKLTSEMRAIPTGVPEPINNDLFTDINFKMDYANALCRRFKQEDTMARIAIRAIRERRASLSKDQSTPCSKTAYIIRQLKRPNEVHLLRRVYGRQFLLISAYGSVPERTRRIEAKLRRSLMPLEEIPGKIEKLFMRDAEEDDKNGQHLRETFHLADVFIDGINRQEMDNKVLRFVHAFFGRTNITPSKEEYGMYAAKSASLRSADLSRQVGAAIFSSDGELITQGCNEVPKAFGGTYWDLEKPDYRDVNLGQDPNELLKRELLRDLFDRLLKRGLLSDKVKSLGSASQIVEKVTSRSTAEDSIEGALTDAAVMDLTEFGRIVHAEMCAICDAARLGRSVKTATLFCTTFPCHNCTKHIIAPGIKRVVYMEPYPKSKAKDLHQHEIEIESSSEGKVSFVPFLGISPSRYRDIFQKGRRKRPDGTARRWYHETDEERPMIDVVQESYPDLELHALAPLIGETDIAQTPSDNIQGNPT